MTTTARKLRRQARAAAHDARNEGTAATRNQCPWQRQMFRYWAAESRAYAQAKRREARAKAR